MNDEKDQQQAGIKSSDDVTPEDVRDETGVEFADPANKLLPLDTARHIHAAWNYIKDEKLSSRYSDAELEEIKARILRAAEKHKIQISV